jgi:hypothetical protein
MSAPVQDFKNGRAMDFCPMECTPHVMFALRTTHSLYGRTSIKRSMAVILIPLEIIMVYSSITHSHKFTLMDEAKTKFLLKIHLHVHSK